MNALLNQDKEKNNALLSKKGRTLFLIMAFMIIIAGTLLMLGNEAFITPAVLLIFFAVVLLIIKLFMVAVNATKNRDIKLSNSVSVVYEH